MKDEVVITIPKWKVKNYIQTLEMELELHTPSDPAVLLMLNSLRIELLSSLEE